MKKLTSENEAVNESMRRQAEKIRRNVERTEANQMTNADGVQPMEPADPGYNYTNDRQDSFATD